MSLLGNFFASRIGIFLFMLVFATGSWIYVTAAESRVDTFPGSIPISFKNVPEDLVPITDTDAVEVRLRADQRSWSLLSADSFVAVADLKNLGAGVHDVPITVAVDIPNVQVVEKRPAKILVRLEESLTKDVPVRVVVQGKAADGKAPGDPIATPNRVLVSGAKSIVAAITDAEAVVTLGGESADLSRTVRVQAAGKDGKPLSNIEFEPTTVGVRIPIVQASNARAVGVRAVTTGSPKDGFYVQKIAVTPATATITGGSDITSLDTKPIDLTGLADNKTIAVDLVLPTGARVVDGPSRATVALTVAPVPTSKLVPLTFTFSDLDPTLQVSTVNPVNSSVVISGTSDVVAAVNSVTATVSLAGQAEGSHSINLTPEMVHPPNGTTVSGTPTPSAITVTLTQK